ncbi:MAG TPA: hypothetical protein VHA52_03205, partial [Candidatus Babeliaceae bacterium]|nr:hypothetical protein [Candidatus Babeliaceae bacterium]
KDNDLYSAKDPEVRVGGGILYGATTDITTHGDTIFIAISNKKNPSWSGVFSSQAIFDHTGKIKGWTPWQRAIATINPVHGVHYDGNSHSFWYIEQENSCQIKRTGWTTEDNQLSKKIQDFLPENHGGTLGLFSFPSKPCHTQDSHSGIIVGTGYKKVWILPIHLASLSKDLNPESLVLYDNDPILKSIGTITTACVASHEGKQIVCVGGSHGVAALTHDDGSGLGSLSAEQFHHNAHLSWRLLKHCSKVNALSAHGDYLYIQTPLSFERVSIAKALDNPQATRSIPILRMGKVDDYYQAFNQVSIIGSSLLCATSQGLMQVPFVQDQPIDQLKPFVLPEALESVRCLYRVKAHSFSSDGFLYENLYLLNTSLNSNQARIYRVVVRHDSKGDIDYHLFPDFFVKDEPTFFVNLNSYATSFATNGALLGVTQSNLEDNSQLGFMDLQKLGMVSFRYTPQLSTIEIPQVQTFASLIYEPALGLWCTAGNFGLRILN